MPYRIIDTSRTLGIVLAGGKGTRIGTMVQRRAKPAISFGAIHRLIDIPVSNLLHSGVTRIAVVAQRKPHSLIRHLGGYQGAVAWLREQFINVLTPPLENCPFMSDAHSLLTLRPSWQSLKFQHVIIMMADQVVSIDLRHVLQRLQASEADAVLVHRCTPIKEAAGRLGVMTLEEEIITGFEEKPSQPKNLQDDLDNCSANLAIIGLTRDTFFQMLDELERENQPNLTLSQIGLPWLIRNRSVVGYELGQDQIPGMTDQECRFFADLGTPDAWYDMHMQLCDRNPPFNLFNPEWPILTANRGPLSPVKIDRVTEINRVLFGPNSIVQDGASLDCCVIGTGVVIEQGASVRNCVLLDDVRVGRGCELEGVVLDKNIVVPMGRRVLSDEFEQGVWAYDDFLDYVEHSTNGDDIPLVPVRAQSGPTIFFPKDYHFS